MMKSKIQRTIRLSFLLKMGIILFLLAVLQTDRVTGQVFEVKKWTGTYPDMEGSYPLTFIAFKGSIIGIPHVFIRYWPTHNYKDMIAKSTVDATEISGKIRTDLAKNLMRLTEQTWIKGRFTETSQIKINTKHQNEIVQKIFKARSDQLGDIWELTKMFLRVYHQIDRFHGTGVHSQVKGLLKEDADKLFTRFLLINLLKSGHGQKMDSLGDLEKEVTRLLGQVDYTFKKLQYFDMSGKLSPISYSVLTR
ncbi:hypothetical protein [Mariniphaga sediminis]|uniref:hypothetical protein n=1 Tax=Mariniphaga sediminis TaxID=1628158 RepID=UPI003568B9E9